MAILLHCSLALTTAHAEVDSTIPQLGFPNSIVRESDSVMYFRFCL